MNNTKLSASDFWIQFRGTPYAFGGLTASGVDCSGLVKLYFMSVHGVDLPHSSREQRGLGEELRATDFQNEDLIFGIEQETGLHHVGLYFENGVWHADRHDGVVHHSLADFAKRVAIECRLTMPSTT